MTTAQKISQLLNDDGQRFEAADGTDIDTLCQRAGGRQEWRDGYRTGDVYAWRFDDGSSIVGGSAAWDIGVSPDCYCWAGVGHSDDCKAAA